MSFLLKILLLILSLSAFSCKSAKDASSPKENAVSAAEQTGKIDYDFTKMNFNIATAQIFDMTVDPDKYLGKTVRFRGQFMSIEEEGYSTRFFSVLQYDATACCQTGFMFFLPADKKYPDDYPAEMSEIEVVGTLTADKVDDMDITYLSCENFTVIDEAASE